MARISVMKVVEKTVTSAGTAELLVASSLYADSVVIQADPTNTGNIYIADTAAKAQGTGGRIVLAPGASYSLEGTDMGEGDAEPFDLNDLYIDAAVSTDGVNYAYVTRSGNIGDQV